MSDQHRPQTEPTPEAKKKPYEAPRILSREPLEAVAAVCSGGVAKINAVACPNGQISS
jgi:hypothetical protein